jgi:hypothetical protein
VAANPEALAQLARLLGDERLRGAKTEAVRSAVEERFPALVDGLIIEATASDDVIDRDSGLAFLNERLSFFGDLISPEQRTRLLEALRAKLEAW